MVLRVCRKITINAHDAEDAAQAVFLVLASKARRRGWQNSIANWLYGVAWRISKNLARRNARLIEKATDLTNYSREFVQASAEDEAVEQLVYPALYQLAEKFRAPIILCDIEGKSRSDAAIELGVTESTVKGRLERGREILRRKLAGHGVTSLAILASGAIAKEIAAAAIPKDTVTAWTQASASFTTQSVSFVGSSTSISLCKEELLKMWISSQLQLVALFLGILGAFGSGALLLPQINSTTSTVAQAKPLETDTWKQLAEEERDVLTKNHLRAIMHAVHAYVDDHNGMLPPAEVPNPNLPAAKRLSGLVLILPYLGVRPSYIEEQNPDWLKWHADNARAKSVFALIDLTKAWDDPVNAKAANSIIPEFLSPDEAVFTDKNGAAVSHFAFVRGSRGRDCGMFPLTGRMELAIPDINDGTSNTLAIGQVHSEHGPWIAAGSSTARFINHQDVEAKTPGFGSRHAGCAYFANGDGYTYFWEMATSTPETINSIAGRDDRELIEVETLSRFETAMDWKNAKQNKDPKR